MKQKRQYSVAVVIPTIGNCLLKKAIQSVQAQTYRINEIIVVADIEGPIDLPDDLRLKLIRVGPRAGGNVARQAGINESKSDVIALLDDDDEWLPNKVEAQLTAVAERDISNGLWLSSSRILITKPNFPEILVPKKLCEEGEKLTHYLFKRTGIKSNSGFIQSSAMMFPRNMAVKVPFDGRLRYHQDIAWIVDVCNRFDKLVFIQCAEALVIKNSIDASVSKTITHEKSIAWARERLSADPRILGDFILTQSLLFAKNSGLTKNMIHTILAGLKFGSPGFAAIIYSLLTTLKAIVVKPR